MHLYRFIYMIYDILYIWRIWHNNTKYCIIQKVSLSTIHFSLCCPANTKLNNPQKSLLVAVCGIQSDSFLLWLRCHGNQVNTVQQDPWINLTFDPLLYHHQPVRSIAARFLSVSVSLFPLCNPPPPKTSWVNNDVRWASEGLFFSENI